MRVAYPRGIFQDFKVIESYNFISINLEFYTPKRPKGPEGPKLSTSPPSANVFTLELLVLGRKLICLGILGASIQKRIFIEYISSSNKTRIIKEHAKIRDS